MRTRVHVKKQGNVYEARCLFFALSAEGNTQTEALEALKQKLLEFFRDNYVGDVKFEIVEQDGNIMLVFDNPQFVLAASLLAHRRAKGWTLQTSVEKAGEKSKGGLAQYESGRNVPGLKKLRQFLNAFGYELVLDVCERQQAGTKN